MANKKIKLLFIEDDSFLVDMYLEKFESEGFDVSVAENGQTGLELAKKVKPDVILLDILLPKKNGFDVLTSLKRLVKTKEIPVLVLTNLGQKEEVSKGISKGANGYLIKAHFMPSEVVEKIKKVVNDSD